MLNPRLSLRLAGIALLCATLFPLLAMAGLEEDLQTMQTLENAARQKSLALLAVLKNMEPELAEGTTLIPMARVVSGACAVREARDPDSRIIHVPNLNDEYPVLNKDDTLVLLDLGERRTGWVEETNLQLFEQEAPYGELKFNGVDPKLLRRYAVVIDELLTGIDEDRVQADELLGNHVSDPAAPAANGSPDLKALREAHARIVDFQSYAQYFQRKYIVNYDFSLQNKQAFLHNLSAWGEALVGKSTFTTKTLISPTDEDVDEIEGNLLQLSLGGNLGISDNSAVRASFAKKNEVNQTPYSTLAANAGFSHDLNASTNLDFLVDTYSYADDINVFNDFRRNIFQFNSHFDRPRNTYHLGYTFTDQSFDRNEVDNFSSHGLNGSARWKRPGSGVLVGRIFANFESSDADYHNFSHLTPSLEYSHRTGTGQVRWKGVYELLKYNEANLRSFNRAYLSYDRSTQDGARRKSARYSATHKKFPDNPLSTYVQVKATWNRSQTGPVNKRFSFNTYTNFHLDNSDNNYTDLRLGRGRSSDNTFSDFNLFSRLWHRPGETTETTTGKPYILDVFGKFGLVKGNLRFGPTVGLHMMAAKGSDMWKQDGNLVRVGAIIEGFFSLAHGIRLNLNASYDYGFVYSDEIAIDPGGDFTVGETVQRHPTTLQVSAFGSMPVHRDFDLTAKLMVYRIATDMTTETSITPVTDNDRFTLFVGLRYHHN